MLISFALIFITSLTPHLNAKVISPLSLGDEIKSKITTLNDGTFLVTTFNSMGMIYDDQGSLVNRFLFREGPSAHAQVVLNDETILIAWTDFNEQDSILRVYAQKFNTNGEGIGKEFMVSSHSAVLEKPETISIATLKDGGFVIAWSWENNQENAEEGLVWAYTITYAQIFNEDTTRRAQRIKLLDSDDNKWVYNSVITHCENGGFIVFWEEKTSKRDPPKIRRQSYDPHGEKIGHEITIEDNTKNPYGQMTPTVVNLISGDIVLIWRDWEDNKENQRYLIHGKVLNSNGVLRDSPFVVQTNGFSTSPLSQVSVAALNDNGFVVVWSCEEPEKVYFRVYRADGKPHGNPTLVNHLMIGDGDNRSPSAAGMSDGGFIVTWDFCTEYVSSCVMYAQRYNRDGMLSSFYKERGYDDL